MVYFGKNRLGIEKISAGFGPVVVTGARGRFKRRGNNGKVALMSTMPSLGKQIENVKKNIKEMKSKEELKHLDNFALNDQIIYDASAPTLVLLNAMTQGDLVTQREGSAVSGTSVQFRMWASNPEGSLSPNLLRHIIFYDAQSNGAAPTIGALLDLSVVTEAVYAPYNYANQKRFKIIFDNSYTLNQSGGDGTNGYTCVSVSDVGKLNATRTTKYISGSAGGGISDINSNALYALWISNWASPSTNAPLVSCGYRFYFKDD